MICKNCGALNDDKAKFCSKCGNPINTRTATKKSKTSPITKILIAILIIIGLMTAATAYVVYFDVSPVEVTQLNSQNAGNVLSNSEIANNIEDTQISSQICNMTENGVPVYKIGDGTGPVTVISAGVHGDQLVPTIAAMDLINYLDGRKINGTVYVIPFASPKALSENTKLTDGVNLNTVADEQSTTSNDIVNLAIESNASAVGDFHETEVGKNPGKTTIMCSEYPTIGSYQLATVMSMLSLDTTMTYFVAGIAYEGAIEDVLNLNGTPAVTPLVLVSSHGEVHDVPVKESYDQMLALLIANGNLNPDDPYLKLANMDLDGLNN